MKKKMNKKGFSLIELLLVLGIIAVLSVLAFVTYTIMSEKALLKKETDFTEDWVTTTISLYQGQENRLEELGDLTAPIKDVMLREKGWSEDDSYKLSVSPFYENVTVVAAMDEEVEENGGKSFVFRASYPAKNGVTQSRCINLANYYLGRYGNVQLSHQAIDSLILSTDQERNSKVSKLCEAFADGKMSGGSLGFYF